MKFEAIGISFYLSTKCFCCCCCFYTNKKLV